MLFVDAGNDRVGIGVASPAHAVHIAGATTPELIVEDTTNNVKAVVGADNSVGRIGTDTNHDLTLRINDTETARIDTSGRLLVGTSSSKGIGSGTAGGLQLASTSHTIASITAYSNSTVAGTLVLGKSRGTSIGSNTIVQDGDTLGEIRFAGADGSDLVSNGAKIAAQVSGTPGSDDMPCSLLFSTTADGASTSTERMRIKSDGSVLIGQTSMSCVLGTGLGVKSDAVGSGYNTGALALEGTGGDFYGLTFNKTGTTSSEGFGFLSVFSSATDSLQIGYNDGSSNQFICTFSQNGNVDVAGALSKGSGSFRIDHPLPAKTETHDLVHSFIEGPQADLIYRGKVDLVAGAATVNLDTAARMTEGTFVLLNTNVQCFTTNESDWTAVRGSVSGNTLTIAAEDNTSTATVSWLVIGERQDQHMIDTDWTDDNGRVITEPEKPS